MNIFGQLEQACVEQLSTDPVTAVQGRLWENTTEDRIKHDNGINKRAIFRNDGKIIIGNDSTLANNVRIHRGGAGLTQDVLGSDATSEGSTSPNLAQRSSRDENCLSSALPTVGNIGRKAYVTDQKVSAIDDGSSWRRIIPEFSANDATTGVTVQLATITSSVVRLTAAISTIQMIPAGFNSQRVVLINRTGFDVVVSNASGATPANQILTGTGANLTFKSNSSLPLQYDAVTLKWQVIGEAAGAASGGGSLPNSSVYTANGVEAGTNYSVLATDDVLVADCSGGDVVFALPTASGNFGKRYLLEKIGSQSLNKMSIVGPIFGLNGGSVATEVIWANNAPYEVVSNGSNWVCVSAPCGTVHIQPPNSYVDLAAVSTANVLLETMSVAAGTTIDNIQFKTGNRILLRNQSAPEENGIYLVPAVNITINATANANVNIATLSNGDTVPTGGGPVFVSTGQKVSLRFQTTSSENGIYVVGATDGTTVRDTSLRDPTYAAAPSLANFVGWSDFYNYTTGVSTTASSPTESVASHTNDQQFWQQTNRNLTTFSGLNFTISNQIFNLQIPLNATSVELDFCPHGGAGGGATAARGGGGGAGVVSQTIQRKVQDTSGVITLGQQIQVTMSPGSKPGGGKTGAAATSGNITVFEPTMLMFGVGGLGITGMAGGNATGGGGNGSSGAGGGPYGTTGASNGASSLTNYFAGSGGGGVVGTGGALGGGGGAPGCYKGGSGGNSTALASALGANGGPGYMGSGGGGGGGASGAGARPGRGGFGGVGWVALTWK